MFIVDAFEPVHIQQQQAQGLAAALGLGQLLVQGVLDMAAVVQAGEFIGQGQGFVARVGAFFHHHHHAEVGQHVEHHDADKHHRLQGVVFHHGLQRQYPSGIGHRTHQQGHGNQGQRGQHKPFAAPGRAVPALPHHPRKLQALQRQHQRRQQHAGIGVL